MEKLVITSTVDSTGSYPGNPHMPPIDDVVAVADEYIRCANAGGSVAHIHGVRYPEKEFQPDGRRASRIVVEGWATLTDRVRESCDSIIQFGIAASRLEDKRALMALNPEMMSFAFNPHDEYFQPDQSYPPNEVYALHPRQELQDLCKLAVEHGVKPEVECFYTGAFWNLEFVRAQGLLHDPIWVTLFLGWPGGTWTPPTFDALLYMVSHLSKGVNWNLSVMDRIMQWKLLPVAIAMGGHVRVGWEDNPYLPDGSLARSNAELVATAAAMARSIGREVATPDEARTIIGLRPRATA
jgi:3-keto-5-aminohexanoate cleavage enzyme